MVLKNDFVNADVMSAVHPTHHNDLATAVNSMTTGKADLASPTFTGTPAAPTPTAGDSTTKLATTAFVGTAVSPKANSASPTFTGTVTASSVLAVGAYATVNTDFGIGASVRSVVPYNMFGILNSSAGGVAAIIRAAASQTASLLRFEDNAGARMFDVAADGKLLWGSTGDTNLYRSAADQLKTDDALVVVGIFYPTSIINNGTYDGTGQVKTVRASTGLAAFTSAVSGEANNRFYAEAGGKHWWSDGTAAVDTNLYRSAADTLTTDDDLAINTAGKGLKVKEGTNAKSGVSTLVGGTVVVSTTAVTASSRIQLTAQSLGTVTAPKALAVSARTAGTSFTILSADATDTSPVAWFIVEPA